MFYFNSLLFYPLTFSLIFRFTWLHIRYSRFFLWFLNTDNELIGMVIYVFNTDLINDFIIVCGQDINFNMILWIHKTVRQQVTRINNPPWSSEHDGLIPSTEFYITTACLCLEQTPLSVCNSCSFWIVFTSWLMFEICVLNSLFWNCYTPNMALLIAKILHAVFNIDHSQMQCVINKKIDYCDVSTVSSGSYSFLSFFLFPSLHLFCPLSPKGIQPEW